ncbi:hypothetical protein KBD13_03105 [Patescibacteria group bacterium]|nr:hypothetical protein [Patescibacteria group bacterium]MDQ5919373.1 hypothetical protein [Patescibacteria group bacterium]
MRRELSTSISVATSTTAIVPGEDLPPEEGLVRPVEGQEGEWRTHSTKRGDISFSYPSSFFLLDKTDTEIPCVYMSPREIFFSEFAGGYVEPIELCLLEDSSAGHWMNDLTKARTSKAIINGKNAVITSVEGEVGAYGGVFSTLSILFPDQRLRITGMNRWQADAYPMIKETVERIGESIVLK